MRTVHFDVFLAVVVFWFSAVTATAQSTQQIPSAPLGGLQITEQNVVGAEEKPAALVTAPFQEFADLCLERGQSDAVAEQCEAARLDLIRAAAASAQAAIQAIESQVEFNAQARIHTLAALEDQAVRGEILFWTVMLAVALGLIAAAFQFRRSWKSGDKETPTEFAISEKQVSIKTAWIGVVLLAMSMVFLALYLTLVYPIVPI